jgi:predicted secreted protein
VNLTQDDSGGTSGVRVGEEITVALDETPTTGYRWFPVVDSTRLRLTADEYEGPERPLGAGGTRRLTFVPLEPGPVRLRLVKRRPWEQNGVDEFAVTLDVTAG